MKTYSLCQQLALLLFTAYSVCAFAEDEAEKKWELGLGIGSIYGPDYRGSNAYHTYTAPIPYVIYRGKYIRSDRDGIRGEFLNFDRVQFTFSASASITPNTDDNILRVGMPELGSTVEFGPAINIQLTGDEKQGWQLQMPWRGVYTIGSKRDQFVGSIFQPQFIYDDQWSHWSFSYRIGLMYANQHYHDYYYSVASQYASQNRPEFLAAGGYGGWVNQVSMSRKLEINDTNTRIAFLIRYDNLQAANFTTSPLVETDHVVRAGVAFVWVFK